MHDCSWGALVVGIQPLFPRVQVTVFLTTPRMVQYQNVSMKVIPKTIPHMFSNNLTETLTLCLKKKKVILVLCLYNIPNFFIIF